MKDLTNHKHNIYYTLNISIPTYTFNTFNYTVAHGIKTKHFLNMPSPFLRHHDLLVCKWVHLNIYSQLYSQMLCISWNTFKTAWSANESELQNYKFLKFPWCKLETWFFCNVYNMKENFQTGDLLRKHTLTAADYALHC